MVATSDSKYIFLYGGIYNNTFYDDIWRYHVESKVWEELTTYGIESITRKVNLWDGSVLELELEV